MKQWGGLHGDEWWVIQVWERWEERQIVFNKAMSGVIGLQLGHPER
jgi:hypothetical protein